MYSEPVAKRKKHEVKFVDALNTMSDPSIPLTTEEWEQWGNPNQQKYYNLISTYSPYDNITPKNYPVKIYKKKFVKINEGNSKSDSTKI